MYEGRPTGGLTPQKLEFARSAPEADRAPSGGSLLEAVQQLQPSALIGAAAKQGAFSADTIKALTKVSAHVTTAFALAMVRPPLHLILQDSTKGLYIRHVVKCLPLLQLAAYWDRQLFCFSEACCAQWPLASSKGLFWSAHLVPQAAGIHYAYKRRWGQRSGGSACISTQRSTGWCAAQLQQANSNTSNIVKGALLWLMQLGSTPAW